MSSDRRPLAAAALALLTSLAAAAPLAAEIVAVGEPLPLNTPVPFLETGDVVWLPPGATADRPAGFLVAWGERTEADSTLYRTFVPRDAASPVGPLLVVAGPGSFHAPRLDAIPDRRSVLVAAGGGFPSCYGGFLYDAALDTEFVLEPAEPGGGCNLPFLRPAFLWDGNLLVVVAEQQVSQFAVDLVGQLFSNEGDALGEPFAVARENDVIRLREVVATPEGFLVFSVDASQNRFDPFGASTLRVQRFDFAGQPLAELVEIAGSSSLIADLDVVPIGGGLVVVWREIGVLPVEGLPIHTSSAARRLDATGAPVGPVQPLFADETGTVHSAAAPGPGDTVLLAWLRATDAGSELRAQLVTADLAPAGEPVTLVTRPADAAGLQLATGPAGDALAVWGEPDGTLLAQRFAVEGECAPSETVLCLQGDRFEVTVEWADFQSNVGPGRRVPVASDDSGLFWFFHPDNWEMLVKIIDGCPVNGHFWVFSAAGTNVQYALTVNDLVAHETRVFHNELGDTARALTVTNAFPTCGAGGGG